MSTLSAAVAAGRIDTAYLGHLLARIEVENPDIDESQRLCACWLIAVAAASGADSWSLSLEDVEHDGRAIGTLSLRIDTARGTPDPLTPQRRAWLSEEGAQVLAAGAAVMAALSSGPATGRIPTDRPDTTQSHEDPLSEAALTALHVSHRGVVPPAPIYATDMHGRRFRLAFAAA